ncbi:hypothetical protein [Legionella sp.]|uniref:hypothetical protein n=1 Tax=Legionella sp. TaxID=459 RepID=UPI003C834A1E
MKILDSFGMGVLLVLGLILRFWAYPGSGQSRKVADMETGLVGRVDGDFSAITALEKMRTETDLPLLMQRLENPLHKLEDTPESQFIMH